ncbi:MAG: hypothetical protein JWM74_4005 [Myxococcaceae bacterium]|nr:hypothetical protein [Myxococcaceae bacterium]
MVDIRQTAMGGDLKDFLGVVDRIYKDDSHYIRPLDMDLRDRLDPKKNPFFEHAEGTVFTAYESGARRKCVGRITAQIDREHLDRHKDETGFFGFLDTIDDPEVARELLARAESWLRQRGMKKVRGPYSLSINEESGCLVEGFDDPPVLLNPHHRSYQGGLIEQAGYKKEKDLYGWRYEVGDLNARVRKARDDIRAMPEVVSRQLSKKDLERDVKITLDIFNDAWAENWGFVPMTKKEADKMSADLKLFLVPEITRIVTIDGEPAAVALAMPNINELIPDLQGRHFPLGIAKLLYPLKVVGAKSGRLLILGIKKKFRLQRKYAGLSLFLYAEMNDGGRKCGMSWGELGWTLEDNAAVNTGIRMMGAKKYKTYRVYTKDLATS